ncbi:NADase-type glycan-binding domain-containing protein [Streptomyces camelliae]|uniref:Zinc ribbon domain-containing protein n=1 Tax=Streptomyces camelliae TaxID=3004093 RepID=A0ABY7PCS3_9ACTN|nr:zinc ribbon domain-containing protein [Streptomyces sp. HUAS 2-6]WBO68386.1 zinc ribbon domain-containing protein [Streptomyces sp. HUAS 2-6]
MRACPACGASNDPADDFCGNCGAYLGWSEEGSRDTSAPPAAPEPPAPPAPAADETAASRPSTSRTSPSPAPRTSSLRTRLTGRSRRSSDDTPEPERAQEALAPVAPVPASPVTDGPPGDNDLTEGASSGQGIGAGGAERGADEQGPTTSRTPDTASTPSGTPDTATAPPPAPAPPVRPAAPAPPVHPAASVSTPSSPPQSEDVGPVQPAKPVAPRPVVRAAAVPEEEVSGVPCPVCGTPNPPGRRFCRRCASLLTPAADRAPLPWWRTIWPLRRRVRAGSGRWIRVLVTLAVILALCVGGFFLLPAGRALFEDTRDKLGGVKAVTPVAVHASAEVPGHPAKNTTDGLSNRYWGAPGAGASITYTFGKPFRMVDLIITNGASNEPEEYDREARALRMDMEVTSADGTVHRKEIDLGDKAGWQTVTTGIDDVVKVRLVLGSVTGLTARRHVAVAEVEFFQRS